MFEIAERIYRAALCAVKPESLIRESVIRKGGEVEIHGDRLDLRSFDRVYVVSFGKAARGMADGLMELAGDCVFRGIVVSAGGKKPSTKKLAYIQASHPIPDERSVRAGNKIISLAEGATDRDLVIVLISGGGSSLVCLPAEGLSLENKKKVTGALLRAGADIRELNTVRKHLSGIKGGRLARAVYPAAIVNLIVSDVIDNDPESIASGPTYWDSSTFHDASKVLEKYEVWEKSPQAVRRVIEAGMAGEIKETMKRDDPVFSKVRTYIVGDNLTALRAARKEAEASGFDTIIMTASDHGEARTAAKNYVSFMNSIACSMKGRSRPLCFLAGGELTVTVKGRGRGGRNTEFALAVLAEMIRQDGEERFRKRRSAATDGCGPSESSGIGWLAASLGTDGRDGPTDAAGAWVGPEICEEAKALGLDAEKYLKDNDSYAFFKKAGGLIITGPTATNVMDLRLFLIAPSLQKKVLHF